MSEAGVMQSIRYCKALCCWHRRTVTPSLYCTRSRTSSQCKSTCSRRDRPWSNLRVVTSAPRLVQSYSNRGASWQRRARVSSRTQRRVNVGLVSVGEARKNTSHTRWRRAYPDWGPMISSRQGRGRGHWQQQCLFQAGAMGHHFLTECANIWSPHRPVLFSHYISLSLLADIQWLTSVRQCSSLVAANVISSRKHFKYSCVSSAYAC